MLSSRNMLSSTSQSTICDADFFFDENVDLCQPCQDLCSGPEKQEGHICEINCKEFMERSSKNQQNSTIMYIIISVSLFLVALLFVFTILCVMLRKNGRIKKLRKQTDQLPSVQHELENINSQKYIPSQSESEDQPPFERGTFSIPIAKSIQRMTLPKLSRPSNIPSKQNSFVSHVSSEYAFREDDRNSLNGHSELGSSLHSSVIESLNYYPGESKPFFQDLTGLLSGLNFVKSIWATDSGVNIALSQEEFAINERCVRERLQALLPKHEANIKMVNIVTV